MLTVVEWCSNWSRIADANTLSPNTSPQSTKLLFEARMMIVFHNADSVAGRTGSPRLHHPQQPISGVCLLKNFRHYGVYPVTSYAQMIGFAYALSQELPVQRRDSILKYLRCVWPACISSAQSGIGHGLAFVDKSISTRLQKRRNGLFYVTQHFIKRLIRVDINYLRAFKSQ